MKEPKRAPYLTLGNHLKRIREKNQESLAEVSGAVEIEVTALTDIEQGVKRPSEDILVLLLNHFAISDDEAVEIWEMAGYSQPDDLPNVEPNIKQVVVMPMDARIAYTDMAHVVVNSRGVVMNFMQESGLGGQPLAVARIGMSRTHAKEVLSLLKKALEQQDKPKSLPAPESSNDPTSEKNT